MAVDLKHTGAAPMPPKYRTYRDPREKEINPEYLAFKVEAVERMMREIAPHIKAPTLPPNEKYVVGDHFLECVVCKMRHTQRWDGWLHTRLGLMCLACESVTQTVKVIPNCPEDAKLAEALTELMNYELSKFFDLDKVRSAADSNAALNPLLKAIITCESPTKAPGERIDLASPCASPAEDGANKCITVCAHCDCREGDPHYGILPLREIWRTGKILSWWDMKKWQADIAHMAAVSLLSIEHDKLPVTHTSYGDHRESLENIQTYAGMVGLTSTLRMCRRIIVDHFSGGYSDEFDHCQFRQDAHALRQRIEDDFESHIFLVLEAGLVESLKGRFSFDARLTFENSGYDMDEAANCFALDRFTACAFHLMRVVEAGAKGILSKYGIDYAPTWDAILKPLKKRLGVCQTEIDQERDKQSDHAKELRKEKKALNAVIDPLENIKQTWRNPTLHVERRIEKDEAEYLFTVIPRFVDVLVKGFF